MAAMQDPPFLGEEERLWVSTLGGVVFPVREKAAGPLF